MSERGEKRRRRWRGGPSAATPEAREVGKGALAPTDEWWATDIGTKPAGGEAARSARSTGEPRWLTCGPRHLHLTQRDPHSTLKPKVKTSLSSSRRCAGGEGATAPPRVSARTVTALRASRRTDTVSRFCGWARPRHRGLGPESNPTLFPLFPFSFLS
jgi:hypothetical protein